MMIFFFNFLAVLGHDCFMQAVSICDEWKLLLVAVHRLFIEVSSFVAEHKL